MRRTIVVKHKKKNKKFSKKNKALAPHPLPLPKAHKNKLLKWRKRKCEMNSAEKWDRLTCYCTASVKETINSKRKRVEGESERMEIIKRMFIFVSKYFERIIKFNNILIFLSLWIEKS